MNSEDCHIGGRVVSVSPVWGERHGTILDIEYDEAFNVSPHPLRVSVEFDDIFLTSQWMNPGELTVEIPMPIGDPAALEEWLSS